MAVNQRKTTPAPMPDREILNIDGAAAFLGVSVKTFSKVLREGDVPGRKVGREWKFARQALIEWVGSSRSRAFLDEADAEHPEPGGSPPRRMPHMPRGAGAPETAAQAAQRRAGRGRDSFSVDEL
jgi:excisionase family DNA binding protein